MTMTHRTASSSSSNYRRRPQALQRNQPPTLSNPISHHRVVTSSSCSSLCRRAFVLVLVLCVATIRLRTVKNLDFFQDTTTSDQPLPQPDSKITTTTRGSRVVEQPNNATAITVAPTISKKKTQKPRKNLLVFGHVHIPMTGGTRRNAILANQLERICTSKGGYSHYRQQQQGENNASLAWETMQVIGFENCDYISHHHHNWTIWEQTIQGMSHDEYQLYVELHVPCPTAAKEGNGIDPWFHHLLKLCQEAGLPQNFACADNWKYDLDHHCGLERIRQLFSWELLQQQQFDGITSKNPYMPKVACFSANSVQAYVDYMKHDHLQLKRFPSSWLPRSFPDDIVLPTDPLLSADQQTACAALVRQHLLETYDYYQFCDQCMNTSMELNLFPSSNNTEDNKMSKSALTKGAENVKETSNSLLLQHPDKVIPPQMSVSLPGNATTTTIPIIYGHLHMAKVAGTELNGILASRFERICGNKGYTYTAIQSNRAYAKIPVEEKQNLTYIQLVKKYPHLEETGGQVPFKVMDEMGFQDCDYISNEIYAEWWKAMLHKNFVVNNDKKRQDEIRLQFELHIPCREDPLDHAMSICNHFGFHSFRCDDDNNHWKHDLADQCKLAAPFLKSRFAYHLVHSDSDNDDRYPIRRVTRCFRPIPIQPYLDYMTSRLQQRRIQGDYLHRATNTPRNKAKECVFWKNNTEFANRVRRYLMKKYDYFRYCNECLGSQHELKL